MDRRPLPDSDRPADAGMVVIHISGDTGFVEACHADLVAALLTTSAHTWDARGGAIRGRTRIRTFGRHDGNWYRFPSKLAWSLGGTLMRRGVPSRLSHAIAGIPKGGDPPRLRPVPVPLARNWDSVGPVLRELLRDPLSAGLGGVIAPGRGTGPRQLVPDLLRMFPVGRAVVVTRNRRGARDWRALLKQARLGRPICLHHEPWWSTTSAVLVCSLAVLDWCRVEDFSLTVVTDVRPMLATRLSSVSPRWGPSSPRATYPLLRDHRISAFGFFEGSVDRLSEAERLTLASWFGPLRSRPTATPRVSVRIIDRNAGPAAPPGDVVAGDVLAAKKAVWRDSDRNDHIARLAADAACQTNGPVTVLVESVEHAKEMVDPLPGWPVVTGEVGGRLPDRAVVTEAWLARGGQFGSGTVVDVRAWGPLRPSDFAVGAEVTVIDVAAGGHAEFRRRAAARLAAYEGYGWTVGATDSCPDAN